MNITFFLIVYAVSAILFWFYRKWKFFGSLKRRGIKGPKPNFFFCSNNELNKDNNPTKTISEWIQIYGDIFGFYSNNIIVIVINDYELIKKLFITHSQIFSDHQEFIIQSYPLDKSLISLKGERWKVLRRYFSPSFSLKSINSLSPYIKKSLDKLFTHLSDFGDEFEIDIHHVTSGFTFDVICNISYGLDGPVYDENYLLHKIAREFFNQNLKVLLKIVSLFPFLIPLFYYFPRFVSSSKLCNILLDKLIEHIKAYCSNKNSTKEHSAILQNFLQLLAEGKISKHEFLANLLLLMLAGYDTTLISICCSLYQLAKDQDIQNKLREDINKNGTASEYLNMVWNETLRFYSPVPLFVERTCNQSICIDGIHFERDDLILCPIFYMHRDERYWTDPHKFIPERFSSENENSNCAFLPFGIGKRKCLGAKLATYEGKMYIYNIIKNYHISFSESTPEELIFICPSIIFNFKDKIILKFNKLEDKNTVSMY